MASTLSGMGKGSRGVIHLGADHTALSSECRRGDRIVRPTVDGKRIVTCKRCLAIIEKGTP